MGMPIEPGKSVGREEASLTCGMNHVPLGERIATIFERTPVKAGAEYVPDLLKDMGHERLVAGMHDITSQLTDLGFSVDVEYFARKNSTEPPLITMIVRGDDNEFIYPNINLRLDPAIPERRGGGDSSRKRTITEESSLSEPESKYLQPLRVERFSPAAEIRILLKESESPDMPYQIEPLFSPQAFFEARAHAAEACRDDDWGYSVIFHEKIVPEVVSRLHQESALFGLREIPEVQDLGSDNQGEVLRLKSWVPQGDGSRPIKLAYAVEQDCLNAAVRSLLS